MPAQKQEEKRDARIPLKVTQSLAAKLKALGKVRKRKRNDLVNLMLELMLDLIDKDPELKGRL